MERPMNTASKHRAIQAVIEDHIKSTEKRHTPVTRVKVAKNKETNAVKVAIYTSRPDIIKAEAADIKAAIKEGGDGREVDVTVYGEARATAKFIRMSPRKARYVIAAIKGKRVTDAIDILRFIPNHASESILKLLRSATANALDGWNADPNELRIHNYIADGGPTLKRIRARAQGRAYLILKRTTHLTVVLLETEAAKPKRRVQNVKRKAAPAPAAPVEETKPVAVVAEEIVETPVAEAVVVETPIEEGNAEQA
jgi:large subunit ribosomal protein L22